ncbi:vWA domain-containing protein [Emticicia sp. 17c]|uniref:vWA domain-containing protein n=1 Tax=Emticicia sp. 17c TaxID=3127704 RepID=UPI00301B7B78
MRRFIVSCLLIITVLFSYSCDNPGGPDCPNIYYNDLKITAITEPKIVSGSSKLSMLLKVDENFNKFLPVSGLTTGNFKVYEKGVNDDCPNLISESEANKQFSPSAQKFRHNTLIVLDLSASVTSSSLTQLKSSTTSFINNILPTSGDDSYQVGIAWFDGEDKLNTLVDFTSNKNLLINGVQQLSASLSKDPSTDLYGAVIKSVDKAEQRLKDLQKDNVISAYSIIIFTDGTDQAARYSKQVALNKVNGANPKITLFTIGLGTEIDKATLSAIGKSGAVFSQNKNELEAKFIEVARIVKGEANSYYLFEYCSPKRAGKVTLVIVVAYDAKKGTYMTTFDATGLTSNCY